MRQGQHTNPDGVEHGAGRDRHGLMMVAFCIPMMVIAVVLLAAGVGSSFLIVAVGCTAMMFFMMRGMSDGDGHR